MLLGDAYRTEREPQRDLQWVKEVEALLAAGANPGRDMLDLTPVDHAVDLFPAMAMTLIQAGGAASAKGLRRLARQAELDQNGSDDFFDAFAALEKDEARQRSGLRL